MPDKTTKRVLIAHVAGAHGIRGEVALKSYAEDPQDLKRYGALADESGGRTFRVQSLRATAKAVLVRFKGVEDRTTAEALRGLALYIDRSVLPPPEPGAYYYADLIGLEAVATDGTAFGRIVAVENYGAGPLLEIHCTGMRATELVPFTDAFVPAVDLAGGRAVVIMPELVGDPEPDSEADDG